MHLSTLLHSPLLDRTGERLGRVEDVIVRLADGGYPPVTGLKARIGGRELFVPIDKIAPWRRARRGCRARNSTSGNLSAAKARCCCARTCWAASWSTSRPTRPASSARTRSSWRASRAGGAWSAWTPPSRAQLRRSLPRGLRRLVADRPYLDWTDMEPFVGHVPTARLRFSHRLANLHPAEIADLVEAASHEEGEELIEAVGQDRELEADVFEELDEAPPARVHRRAPRRAGGGGDRADGPRRRGRPDRRDRAGAPRTDPRAAAARRPAAGSKRCSATTPRRRAA